MTRPRYLWRTTPNVSALAAGMLLWSGGTLAQPTDALVHEGTIAAPVEAVWASWTTSDGLKFWLAPHADINFRIGGRMRANYDVDSSLDDPSTIENTILGIE